MDLDLPTLMAVESFIAALSGLVILLGSQRGRDAGGSVWWAAGSIAAAAGIALILWSLARNSVPLVIAANITMVLSPALFWTAARKLNRRDAIYPLIPAGALLVAIGSTIAAVRVSGSQQMALSFALGAVEAMTGTLQPMHLIPPSSWFGLIHFESIIFSVGTAVFVVAFTRERAEAMQRMVAESDPLTGLSSRRALLDHAERELLRCQEADAPLSLAIFDLDYFKSINDRFGHAVGDAVLGGFGDAVRSTLRRNDRVGRIGGEEFALLLPDTDLATAAEIADRVRAGFEANCRVLDRNEVAATVSAGVTTAHRNSTVQSMLIAADQGLYEAKARGRNRVERPPSKMGRDGGGHLNRVA